MKKTLRVIMTPIMVGLYFAALAIQCTVWIVVPVLFELLGFREDIVMGIFWAPTKLVSKVHIKLFE